MNFFVFPCSTHGYAKQTTTPGLLNSIHFLQNQNPVTAIPLCRRNKNCLPAVLIFCEKFCETDPLTHSSPNANFVPHTSCRFLVYLNINGILTIRRSWCSNPTPEARWRLVIRINCQFFLAFSGVTKPGDFLSDWFRCVLSVVYSSVDLQR